MRAGRYRASLGFASVLALTACHRRSEVIGAQGETLAGPERGPSSTPTPAQTSSGNCGEVPSEKQLKEWLRSVPGKAEAGGLTGGRFEWAAVVNRQGELCAVAVASDDAAAAWPGSQAIAKAKAFTANAFSTDTTALSTARLYTLSQPGHSLWGIASGNPSDPACLSTPAEPRGVGRVCGGTIAFAGGLPLYRGQKRVGGLGVSGDTACADHEIAKRMREAAGLNPPQGAGADDIIYRGVDAPSIYAHPLCPNTWRNAKKLGDEPPTLKGD